VKAAAWSFGLNNESEKDMNVLVVEDERLLNWSLASSLDKWGFNVRRVFTGSEAMNSIAETAFDVFLLDYRLPDGNGLEVAKMIREKQPEAVILLLTAFQFNELSVDAGLIDGYFNKPLDLDQLHEALLRVPLLRGSGAKFKSQPKL